MHDNAETVKQPSAREMQRLLLGMIDADGGVVCVHSGSRWGFAARALQMRGLVMVTYEGSGHGPWTALEVRRRKMPA